MTYPYNPYYGAQMPIMQPPMQQPIQPLQKTAQFYFVDEPQDLDVIKPMLNILYVGLNKKKKEIYVKQLTNEGLISVETYNLAGNKKEKSELETILEKINDLESKLLKESVNVPDNATNVTNGDATVNVGQA